MALYVLKDGCEFEQLLMMEYQSRAEFAFLFDLDSPQHAYYRWRLYSLAGARARVCVAVCVCVCRCVCVCVFGRGGGAGGRGGGLCVVFVCVHITSRHSVCLPPFHLSMRYTAARLARSFSLCTLV
jgi:hypothetical protein